MVKHLDKYDPGREFEPWLTKICVNTYRSALRRLARSPVLDFSSGEDKERFLQSLPAPEERDYSPLYEAVGCLPDKLRLAVVPVGTVKSRLNKARKLLKEELSHEADVLF